MSEYLHNLSMTVVGLSSYAFPIAACALFVFFSTFKDRMKRILFLTAGILFAVGSVLIWPLAYQMNVFQSI